MTAQGSLGRVDEGHSAGEEGLRAACRRRGPIFLARSLTLCGTNLTLYDNVHIVQHGCRIPGDVRHPQV